MTSDRHSLFVQTLGFLFRAQGSITDPFFANRLSGQVNSLLLIHIQYSSATRDQLVMSRDYIRTSKEVSSLLEQIAHVGCADAVLVGIAHERLLSYLQQFISDVKKTDREPVVRSSVPAPQPVRPSPAAPKIVRTKSSNRNQTQEKILEFVKRVPDCRPKDIIGEFSALSQRTVKRSLKELSEMGLIVKKTNEDKAVYYSATSL